MQSSDPAHARGVKILVVDDDPANLKVLRHALEGAGYNILAAPSGEVALKVLGHTVPDVMVLDVGLPGIDGYEVCRQLKANEATRAVPVIFITGHDEPEQIIRGFRVGGVDYIAKPFRIEEVLVRVETHLRNQRLTQELARQNAELEAEIRRRQAAEQAFARADEQLSVISEREAAKWGIAAFVGHSPAFQKLVQDIRRAQRFGPLTVLITGECGTGKELIARAIHYGGAHAKGPFIPLNCSAIPSELAESALFGHVRGAFTGATEPRKGCFEQANGGTLFLDEIGDMPLSLQAKLLRVLEDGAIMPVGGTEAKKVDVRVLAATNAELESAMAVGKFRKDLFFRLARFTIEAPALRDRKEDIPLLADHFVNVFAAEMGMAKVTLTAGAMAALMHYDYPGNVRELRNLMERALMESGGGEVRPEHLQFPRLMGGSAAGSPGSDRVGLEDVPDRGVAGIGQPGGDPATVVAAAKLAEERAILDHVRQMGTINNAECRELLGIGMHRAWYLLRKLHRSGKLKQDSSGRWAQYRLPE